jgi:hypothetical protein
VLGQERVQTIGVAERREVEGVERTRHRCDALRRVALPAIERVPHRRNIRLVALVGQRGVVVQKRFHALDVTGVDGCKEIGG